MFSSLTKLLIPILDDEDKEYTIPKALWDYSSLKVYHTEVSNLYEPEEEKLSYILFEPCTAFSFQIIRIPESNLLNCTIFGFTSKKKMDEDKINKLINLYPDTTTTKVKEQENIELKEVLEEEEEVNEEEVEINQDSKGEEKV
jgi:hypothetical protein